MAIPEHPNNRKERYLAKIAGQAGATIPAHPYTREERYLEAIAEGVACRVYRHDISVTVNDDGGFPNVVIRIMIMTSSNTPYTKDTYLTALASLTQAYCLDAVDGDDGFVVAAQAVSDDLRVHYMYTDEYSLSSDHQDFSTYMVVKVEDTVTEV